MAKQIEKINVTQYTSAYSFLFLSKALLKKKDCADVYCVTLNELQAHRDAFIQNIEKTSTSTGLSKKKKRIIKSYGRFEYFTSMLMETSVFWEINPCILVNWKQD
jgi:hypothetical protein